MTVSISFSCWSDSLVGRPGRCCGRSASNPFSSTVFTQPVTAALVYPADAPTWDAGVPERTILTAKTRNRYFDSSDDVIIALPCSKRIAGSVLYFLRFMFSPPPRGSIAHSSGCYKVNLIISFTILIFYLYFHSRNKFANHLKSDSFLSVLKGVPVVRKEYYSGASAAPDPAAGDDPLHLTWRSGLSDQADERRLSG